jgi:hypothetical protein
MPLVGDTVTLHVEFRNFKNELVDADEITLIIYDSNKKAISDPITITSDHKISTGIYEYNYVIPEGYNFLYYKFLGNPEGLPAVTGGTISIQWI